MCELSYLLESGPECSCVSINTTASNVSCNVTFADSTFDPIYAIVTWKVNGVYLANYTLERTRIDPYVFLSQSTITADAASPDDYECELSFSAPDVSQFPFVVTNVPEFSASCSTSGWFYKIRMEYGLVRFIAHVLHRSFWLFGIYM